MVKKVGYGSPPVHSQFKKGQSGNPKGRRKGSVNFMTDLQDELREIIPVTEGGKPKRITKQRALAKAIVTKGIKGDVRAASTVIVLCAKLMAAELEGAPEVELTPAEREALEDLIDRRAASRPGTPTSGDGK